MRHCIFAWIKSFISLLKCVVQPPLPRSGGGVRPMALRGWGEQYENKSLVLMILKTPFLTFPRYAGKGGNRQRRCTLRMTKGTVYNV
jgi:hypothetical protein